MPTLNVQNAAVRANITQIVEAMRRHRLEVVERHKILPFFINRENGLFQIEPVGLTGEQGYLSIELYLDLDERTISMTEKSKAVDMAQFSKTARRIVSETCSEIKRTMSSMRDLRELSYLELPQTSDRSLLHEAWFAIDRDEAEKLLLKEPKGSYLFRKDPFAGCLEELLATAKKEKIKCFTLTYVDADVQVHDKTIIQWKEHWMFYDDDPTLSGDYYLNFDELLQSLGATLKRPLFPAKVKP
jgi:hypothetical protein